MKHVNKPAVSRPSWDSGSGDFLGARNSFKTEVGLNSNVVWDAWEKCTHSFHPGFHKACRSLMNLNCAICAFQHFCWKVIKFIIVTAAWQWCTLDGFYLFFFYLCKPLGTRIPTEPVVKPIKTPWETGLFTTTSSGVQQKWSLILF